MGKTKENKKCTDAQIRAANKWTREHADRLTLQGPKGLRARIKAAADAQGLSQNRYIFNAVEKQLAIDESATSTTQGGD